MEFQFSFSWISLSPLVFFLLLLLKEYRRSKTRLPPGPWKLPFIGSLHHFKASQLPHHALREFGRKYGRLMHVQFGEISSIVISSPELAKEVLKKQDPAFANKMSSFAADVMFYNKADIAFSPYGDFWRQMRKICMVELLSTKNVRSFASIREDEVWGLISAIRSSSSSTVNLTEKMFEMTSAVTCRAAFGKTNRHQNTLISLLKDVNSLGGGFNVSDLFPSLKLHLFTGIKSKLMDMHRKLDDILEDIIKEHTQNLLTGKAGNGESGEEDIIDVFLRLRENGGSDLDFPINNTNIKAVLFDIFTGGTETSSTTVEWAMSEMVRNPKIMAKAQAEVRRILNGKKTVHESDIRQLNYLKMVIKETFRLHPPLPLLSPRECREESVVNGYKIPIETKVIVNVYAMGRDSEYWPNAENFEPERFENSSIDFTGNHFELIPFGAGKRMCPGMSFGIANVELPLAQLLYHFDWKLPAGMRAEDLDMSEKIGMAVGRKHNLELIATPAVHSQGE